MDYSGVDEGDDKFGPAGGAGVMPVDWSTNMAAAAAISLAAGGGGGQVSEWLSAPFSRVASSAAAASTSGSAGSSGAVSSSSKDRRDSHLIDSSDSGAPFQSGFQSGFHFSSSSLRIPPAREPIHSNVSIGTTSSAPAFRLSVGSISDMPAGAGSALDGSVNVDMSQLSIGAAAASAWAASASMIAPHLPHG